jgi:hypothetical protein
MPSATASTAVSRSASGKTTKGDLPPNSSVTGANRPAAARITAVLTSPLPVKDTFRTSSCSTRAVPVTDPGPVTTFTTSSGSTPAASWAIRIVVSGVAFEGLITAQLPAASAGPSFQAAAQAGKFQDVTCPTTPNGSDRV